jgi:hypothetical protein
MKEDYVVIRCFIAPGYAKEHLFYAQIKDQAKFLQHILPFIDDLHHGGRHIEYKNYGGFYTIDRIWGRWVLKHPQSGKTIAKGKFRPKGWFMRGIRERFFGAPVEHAPIPEQVRLAQEQNRRGGQDGTGQESADKRDDEEHRVDSKAD